MTVYVSQWEAAEQSRFADDHVDGEADFAAPRDPTTYVNSHGIGASREEEKLCLGFRSPERVEYFA